MKVIWRMLCRLGLKRLADTLALVHNSPLVWCAIPCLLNRNQTQSRYRSLLNGLRTPTVVWVGWIESVEAAVDPPEEFANRKIRSRWFSVRKVKALRKFYGRTL
jgi:hypothetical protein